jgi:DNA-binding winged helix-turn-helix (wHTH) protein/WD40 repeat protein
MPGHNSSVFRFSDIEVHEAELHIRRNGEVLPVEPKAFRVLLHLLRNPGRLIPKDELINAGWGDTAVSENSLTRNIALLRRLLGDDPHDPRYIETVTTVGYRFVCPVEATVGPAAAADARIQSPEPEVRKSPEAPHSHEEEVSKKPAKQGRRRLGFALAAIGIVAVCAALLAAWWFIPRPEPVVDSIAQLTEDPQLRSNLVTDGSRVYFNEGLQGSSRIAQVSIEGGRSVPMETSLADPFLVGAARDGSALLALTYILPTSLGSLWSIPLPAGEPRRLGNAVVQSADMFPDNRIVYAVGKDVLTAENDASGSRKLASLPGIVWNTVVSPDGTRVLFQVDSKGDSRRDTFEMLADGTGVRQIRTADANECCFNWSRDGKYLLYSARTRKRWDLWALPVRAGLLRRSEMPVRLTNGPISFSQGAAPSRDGKQIFAIGSKERGQLVRYDMKSRQFAPLLSGISATDATYSMDGDWVAYTAYPEHTLWRSRSDGSERMQLTYPPMEVSEPFISPDGTKVVFDSMGDNSVCVIDMNGGTPRQISASAWSPRWSPDGKSVVYNRVKADGSVNGLEIAEVATGKKSEVPSPNGKLAAFWLDQQTMAAANGDLKDLMIFDFRTRAWTRIVAGNVQNPLQNWINSPDGKYIYYAAGGSEASIQRIRVADRHVETITSLKDFTRVANFGSHQLRVAPDGSPTLTRAVDSEEIYALNVRWP